MHTKTNTHKTVVLIFCSFFYGSQRFASRSQSLGIASDKTVFLNFYSAYICFVFVIDLGREVYKILCQILIIIWPFGLASHCSQCSDILRLASLANITS